MKRLPLLVAVVALLAAASSACRTRRTRSPVNADKAVPEIGVPTRALRLAQGNELLGYAIYFESQFERGFYSVRNAFHQELGMVDRLGRAWRYRPFESEAEWVSTGTLAEGVRCILGAGDGAVLEEISLAEAGAF